MRRMKSGVYSLVVSIYEEALYVALSPKSMEAEFGEPIGEALAYLVGWLVNVVREAIEKESKRG